MERLQDHYEQMLWLHERGLVVTLPPEATRRIASSKNGLPETEAQRVRILSQDSILKKRYPAPEDGVVYMESVDLPWRKRLYQLAENVSDCIVQRAREIGKEDIAVILFGSVAKALSRAQSDPDPSNIDMAVIGDFTDPEKRELFNRIRPCRDQGKEIIGNNIGVHIQTVEKLRKNQYCTALEYIGSSARTLYDPKGIWDELEREALMYKIEQTRTNGAVYLNKFNDKTVIYFQKGSQSH